MSLSLRYIRVTNSTKLKDEFLTAQVYKLDDNTPNHYLFNLVEIKRPWLRASQIGQVIINNFQRSYIRGKNDNQLTNFEDSLKETNQTLNKIYNSGETDWVGRLSASILLSIENNIHFTTSGETKIVLHRNSTISTINQEKISANSQKIFGAITSGKIQKDDLIIIANKKLFDELTLSQISESIKGLNCLQATENIIRQIRALNRKYVNFIIIEVVDELSSASKEQLPKNHFYIDQDVEKVHKTVLKYIKKIGSIFGTKIYFFSKGLWHNSKVLAKEKIVPFYQNKIKKYFKTIRLSLIKGSSKTSDYLSKSSETISSKIDSRISHYKEYTPSEKPKPSISFGKNLVGKNLFTVYDYQNKSVRKRIPKITKNIYFGFLMIIKYIILSISFVFKFLFNTKNKKYLILLGIIFLVIILYFGVRMQKSSQKIKTSRTEQQEILNQAESKLEEAKTSLVFKKNDEAEKQLAEVVILLAKIDSQSSLYPSAQQSLKSAQEEYDKLTNTIRNESQPVNNYSISKITNIAGQIYFITTDKKLFKYNQTLESDELTNLAESENILAISSDEEKNIIYILSNTGTKQFPIETKIVAPITTLSDKAFSSGNSMQVYIGNIYILNNLDKQIYKYSNNKNRFSDQQNYLKDTSSLEKSIDFAIDGFVYILLSDGNIIRYSRGNEQSLSFKNIPAPDNSIVNPISIFTTENDNAIYILDKPKNYRVLSFTKNGDYQKQIIVKDFGQQTTDLLVDENNKKIYLASDKGLYAITF